VTNLLGEHNRLQPKSSDVPYGEDSLLRKAEEINWLTENIPELKIDLLYVSGGDWWDSETIFLERKRIVEQKYPDQSIRLVKTRDYHEWHGRNTNDKGGEWNLGVHLMVNGKLGRVYDAVYLTDADTTFNLAASLGESIAAHLENGWDVILGNRKDSRSVVQKNAKRFGPGAGWQYLITRYLARYFYENKILDTQCPSRFYTLKAANIIEAKASVDTWTAETDHNLALISEGYELHFVPVVAVDSEKESVGFRLPANEPNKAYRVSRIINGHIDVVKKYSSYPGVELPKIEESLAMAKVVKEEIYSYDPDKPWLGLEKLLNYEDEGYRSWPSTDYTPENVSIEEFKRIIKKALEE